MFSRDARRARGDCGGVRVRARDAPTTFSWRLKTTDADGFARRITQEYLTHSPDFADVLNIWDSYHANHAQKVCAPLLALCGTMMTRARETAATSGRASGDGWTERERLALDSLARAIMSRRMRQIYSHLASGVRVRVNAALMTLAGIAGRGKRCASELFRTFDFSLGALPKIAAPPREVRDGGSSSKRRKEPDDVLAGSTRRAFCEFVLAFFATKDRALLRPVLAQRVLFGNVARYAAGDEAVMQCKILDVMKEDVMSSDSGIPARLRAALFGDVTLEQLATIAGQSEDEESTSGRVATMATKVLSELFRDPSHGLVPEGSTTSSKKCASVVRLLQKLRPIECNAHLKILLLACETHPLLATMYLPGAKYTLEPRLSAHWLTSASLLGRIAVAAGEDAASSAVAARLEVSNVVGESEGSAFVKAVLPPGLSKQSLSKGLAHSSPIIRHGSLCLLLQVTRAVAARLTHLDAIIIDARNDGSDQVWRIEELASYARLAATTYLPEIQSIMTAYAASKGVGASEKEATAALLARCHALNAMATLISVVPEILVDAKVDVNRLLPTNDPTSLAPAELAAVVHVLCAATGVKEDVDDHTPTTMLIQESGVNQGHLLSVLRVVIFATSPVARTSARRLAKHYLATSGALDGRAPEADLWIDKLTSFKVDGFEYSRDVLMSCTEFLAEATTAAARRRFRHDSVVQNTLKETKDDRPERYVVEDMSDDYLNAATLSVSALSVTACESIVKVLKSEKRDRGFKLAVSTYVASALTSIVQTSFDPWATASIALEAVGDESAESYVAMRSLHDFLCNCTKQAARHRPVARCVSVPHGKRPDEWSVDELSEALGDLASLSPADRGLALFCLHAHIPALDFMSAGLASAALYGTANGLDENVELTTALVNSLTAADIIALCASGTHPMLGTNMTDASPAYELCSRAIAVCSLREIIRTTRALVFWCKWNHARADTKTTSRLVNLCKVVINRARQEGHGLLHEVRIAMFATTALYTILDDLTSCAVSDLVMFDAVLADGHEGELYHPYVQNSVESLTSMVNEKKRALSKRNGSFNVSLVALASNERKMELLERSEANSMPEVCIQIADAVVGAPSSSSRVRMHAVRFATRVALSGASSSTLVIESCRVAKSAIDSQHTLESREMLSGRTPDFAAAPEALDLVQSVVKDYSSEARVQLAASFIAHSEWLASWYLTEVSSKSLLRDELLKLLPLSAKALRWNALHHTTPNVETLATEYRNLLIDECFEGEDTVGPLVSNYYVEALVSCLQISPFGTDSTEYERFVERVMPAEGWVCERDIDSIRVQIAVRVFVSSDVLDEKLMLMTALLQTLSVLTPPNKTIKRDASTEQYVAESLTRALDEIQRQSLSSVSAPVLNKLVLACEAFVSQSIAHRFRSHRRFVVIGRIGAVLNAYQSIDKGAYLGMQTLAEHIVSKIVAHPLFTRVLTAESSDDDATLPSNVRDMPITVKSIVEVVKDASAFEVTAAPSNSSALKLALLRVLSLFWKLQHANGANETLTCRKWRAQQANMLIALASGYGATMSACDRLAQEMMLDIDASTGGGALRSLGYLWGESVTHFVKATISIRRNENENYNIDDLLYSEPSPALVASAIREGSPPDARRAAATANRYPVTRSTPPSTTTAIDDRHDEFASYGYDPSWVLPFALRSLVTGAMDPRESIAWGLAPLAATALSSHDEATRRVAYAILSTLEDRVGDPLTSFRERTQVLACLSAIRNATSESLIRWPSPSAVFAAECMISCLYPELDTFLPLQRQLNKRAALDLDGIPMFLPMLNSGDVDARQHRLWILRFLRASLKDDVDATMFRKTFALEVVMSHYSTTLAEPFVRFLMLDLVAHACTVPSAARPLIEGGGLISWLASVARAACVDNEYGIRSGESSNLRASTAKHAVDALVALIRQKGSIYLGPTGTAADYLSALQTIRGALLHDDAPSHAAIASRRAALGPYLKLHVELSERLRRRIAEVGDPVEIARLCAAADEAPNAEALRDDMFRVVVTSEGGGQYAKRCTGETFRALADAVIFSASWAAVHAEDVSKRISKRAGEDAFEATARWCANALANGGASFADALMSAYECGGIVRFANIMTACERASSDAARRELRLPCLAARLFILRASQAFAGDLTSEADAALMRTIADDKTGAFVAGGALDRAVAASATGDATAFVHASARLRAAFAGVGFVLARADANDDNQPSRKKSKTSR